MQAPWHILADHHAIGPSPVYTGFVVTVAPGVAKESNERSGGINFPGVADLTDAPRPILQSYVHRGIYMSSTPLYFAAHLLAAVLFGSLVGLERQWRQRMAGTRTNALVAAGAAAFVMAGLQLSGDSSAPGRIASYVVSGVGFLGAGVIFKDGANVRGLNSAATIWCSAAIGVLCGLGYIVLSLISEMEGNTRNCVNRDLAMHLL
jgi:hypothetical protein